MAIRINLLFICLFSILCVSYAFSEDNNYSPIEYEFSDVYMKILSAMKENKDIKGIANGYINLKKDEYSNSEVRYDTIDTSYYVSYLEFFRFVSDYSRKVYMDSAFHLYLNMYLNSKSAYEKKYDGDYSMFYWCVFLAIIHPDLYEQMYNDIIDGKEFGFSVKLYRGKTYESRSDFEGQLMFSVFGDAPIEEMESLIDPEIGLSGFSFFKPIEKVLLIKYNPNNARAVDFLKRLEKESGVKVKKEPSSEVFTFKLFFVANKDLARAIYQKYYGLGNNYNE